MARRVKRDDDLQDGDDEVLRVVGSRLKEVRRKAGLTQQEVATRAGVGQSYINELERGNTNITIKTLCRMADRLGVDVRELLPEGPSLPPTKASIERLAEAFDNLAQVMRERTAQDAELLVALRGFVGLREAIEAWAKSGKMPF
jgi:transcriptional regulator with XRE-family HTH domain